MSDELDPALARLLQDDDRPDLIGVTLKAFMKASVIKVLTVYTAPSTSTALWTCRSLRSSNPPKALSQTVCSTPQKFCNSCFVS
jgi:hypothetical protein